MNDTICFLHFNYRPAEIEDCSNNIRESHGPIVCIGYGLQIT